MNMKPLHMVNRVIIAIFIVWLPIFITLQMATVETYNKLQQLGNMRIANAELLGLELPEMIVLDNDPNNTYYKLPLPFKLEATINPQSFCKNILMISKSCLGYILQPKKNMHLMLWDIVTSISNWPKHCRALVRHNHPKFFGQTKSIQFYGLCGHCKQSPFIVEINAKDFVEPEQTKAVMNIYFSVGYCIHAEYDFCRYRNYSHLSNGMQNIDPMDAILIDLNDTSIKTFGELSNKNSKMIHNANNVQLNKDQREHELIGQSLHLQQQKNHLSFEKPKKQCHKIKLAFYKMLWLVWKFHIQLPVMQVFYCCKSHQH